MNSRRIVGEGTPASAWEAWPGLAALPAIQPSALVPGSSRAVVLAPHPDDEVLGTGGLLAQLARLQRDILLIAVTDGTASHPGSSVWTPARLAAIRPRESEDALRHLGVRPLQTLRADFPDGKVAEHEAELRRFVTYYLRENDVVFATWRFDGHPDHEAVGRAAVAATETSGAHLVEIPIWTWHWAKPGDSRVPWSRAHKVPMDAATLGLKALAVAAFGSQTQRDPSTGGDPVLPPHALARLLLPFEVVLL